MALTSRSQRTTLNVLNAKYLELDKTSDLFKVDIHYYHLSYRKIIYMFFQEVVYFIIFLWLANKIIC